MAKTNYPTYLLAAAAAFLLPLLLTFAPAQASTPARDILIKGPGKNATVYYLAEDGKRYVFPNQQTFATWFSDFSDVQSVSSADLTAFPLGGNVTYRPGIKMVKITTDPKVYAVGDNGELRWITSENLATALYGSDWNRKIDDVPDSFFVNYHVGAPIYAATDFNPQTESDDADSINSDKHLPKSSHSKRADTLPEIPDYPLPHTACAWRCTAWSECDASGNQTRTCSQGSECEGHGGPTPTETSSCTAATPPTPSQPAAPVAVIDDDTAAGTVIGGTDALLAKFKFSAADEDLRLTKLSFTVATLSAATSLSLYDDSTLVAGPVSVDSSGNAFFTDLSYVVPADNYKILSVRGHLNAVGDGGTPSGSNAKVTLKNTSGVYAFEMRGNATDSTTMITSTGGDVAGQDKIVRRSVPAVSLISLSPATLAAGNQAVLRFSVTAGSSGDVSFKAITVGLQKSNELALMPTGDAMYGSLFVSGNPATLAGQATVSADCAANAGTTCTLREALATEEVVPAGSVKTYDVLMDVGGALSSGDSVSAHLNGDTVLASGALAAGSAADQLMVNGMNADFVWSDLSAASHSATVGASSSDWANGLYVKSLPTGAQTLVK